jgi:hypothetical protein
MEANCMLSAMGRFPSKKIARAAIIGVITVPVLTGVLTYEAMCGIVVAIYL